jgi:hypothetical protein
MTMMIPLAFCHCIASDLAFPGGLFFLGWERDTTDSVWLG